MTVHFDTLDFVKTLTAAGVSQAHAEAMAKAHAKLMDDLVRNELASKADLNTQRADMRADFKSESAGLRAELKSEMADLRSELKTEISGLRSEFKSEISGLRSELKADFQVELRSLKYAASIAMAFLSLVVVPARFIH